MERDLDLIREILLRVEEDTSRSLMDITVDGYSKDQIAYNVLLLIGNGYLEGHTVHEHGSPIPIFIVQGMSWEGHEFLDLARSQAVWKQAKTSFVEKGAAMSLEVLKVVLIELTKRLLVP